jgi:hypothetical protein
MLFLLSLLLQPIFASSEYREKIAIIDTGLNPININNPEICKEDNKDFTGTGLLNTKNNHGDNITGIIARSINPNKQCLLILKWYDDDHHYINNFAYIVLYAIKHKAKYINISAGGSNFFESEKLIFQKAIDSGIKVQVAAGNDKEDLSRSCPYYPACYKIKNLNIIGCSDCSSSNYGLPQMIYRNGRDIEGYGVILTGTSQATAVYTAELIKRDNDESK